MTYNPITMMVLLLTWLAMQLVEVIFLFYEVFKRALTPPI
jgi:hypothetical protein